MKSPNHWLVGLFLFGASTFNTDAATWFVSSNGDDHNPGTEGEPMRSITAAVTASASGDTILVARGDVFRESNLSLSDKREIGAYGENTKPLPVLCGSLPVNGWTEVAGKPGVYAANFSASVSKGEPMVFVNGERQTLARYPDTKWLRIDNGSNSNKIMDAELGAATDAMPGKWRGGQVRWRKWSWWYETRPILSDNGAGTLSLGGSSSISNLTGIGGGYYIDNHPDALDAPGEWYWDKAAGTLYLIPPVGVDWQTMEVEMAIQSQGISVSGGAILRNLNVRHYTDVGISVTGGVLIEGCLIEHVWNKGISGSWGAAGTGIIGNEIRDILNVGISWNENPSGVGGSIIERNHLVRCGTVPGLGGNGPWHAAGVIISNAPFGTKGVQFRLNRIEGAGYAGIILGRDGQTVERNVFRDTMNTLNDGAAIYTNCSYSFIRENIILDTEGDLESSHPWTPLGAGIWLEFLSNFHHSEVVGNTVYGSGGDGLFLPNNFDCLIRDNVFLSNLRGGATLGGHEDGHSDGQPYQNHTIQDNLFGIGAVPWVPTQPRNLAAWAARDDACLIFKTHPDRDLDFGTMSGTTFLTQDGLDLVQSTSGSEYSIINWQNAESDWADSDPRVVRGDGYLFINDSEVPVDFPLPAGVVWTDLEGAAVVDTVAIAPFRSVVLLAASGVTEGLPGYQLVSEIGVPVLWQEWLDRYKLSGEDADPDADPDKDGLSNVLEYVLDTSPIRALPMQVRPSVFAGPSPSWQINLRNFHPEWTVAAESSSDLQTWSPAVLEPLLDVVEPGMMRHSVAIDPVKAPFVRLTVTPASNE
jgi:hypothetical protein